MRLSKHLAVAGIGLAAVLHSGQSLATSDTCLVKLPAGVPCPVAAWETVDVEHADRMSRLKRLSRGEQRFSFHEDIVSASDHGLADFPTDIPVLRVVAQQDVFFDSGSDKIRPEAYHLLDIIADSLKLEPPDVALFVSGHTDADGDDESNMKLGLSRAHAVASALVLRGIYQASIYRVSFGEFMPIAPNDRARNKAKNRRVEFLFGAKPEALVVEIKRQNVKLCGDAALQDECRKKVRIEIERVSVSPEFSTKVIELNKAVTGVEASKNKSTVEMQKARQEVEVKREQIPVTISRQKIYVELDR
ncbi:OmpA family protein [Sinorhizobium fredii]|uniref:OmpA/MotB family outer membrane protein n=1 Tax=Rhizobium fredii TaxID=380 RepID=A0A2L0HBX9_RHIFR|nr:OmpA family protein [Sinorhizobium fredii]AUX78907.1 OmpA/MotB family outer membrane protein [Sinorhizobium fredii]